ncbi:MAG: hypothetical protein AAF512_12185, partial [Pseudomonadota bacterium]
GPYQKAPLMRPGRKLGRLDGVLASNIPGADIFLLNPAGVMFGPNARLDLQGSLHTSTAHYLQFGEAERFYTNLAQTSQLSIAPPSAFGFVGDEIGNISIDQSHLLIPAGETFSLVGGDIRIQAEAMQNDFTLNAHAGQVNLVGVSSTGVVPLNPSALQTSDFTAWSDVELRNAAIDSIDDLNRAAVIEASGPQGGRIYIRGGNITVSNAEIFADTLGAEGGLGIQLHAAESLNLSGVGTLITAQVLNPFTSGHGGDIQITAQDLTIEDGAQVSSSSFGTGDAGEINVTVTGRTHLDGVVAFSVLNTFRSGFSNVTESSGQGGAIRIKSEELHLSNSAGINSGTLGTGRAGDIALEVRTLEVDSLAEIGVNSGLPNTPTADLGAGGALTINATESITIQGGEAPRGTAARKISVLASNTFSNSPSGDIIINTPLLQLSDLAAIQSGTANNAGTGGTIRLNVETLLVAQQADITVESLGSGDAGTLDIQANEIRLDDGGALRSNSAQAGLGGAITLQTNNALLGNHALITAQSSGQGDAGTVTANITESLRLEGGSSIATSAATAGGGNIDISTMTDASIFVFDSTITSSVMAAQGDGGNLTIGATRFTVLDESRVFAQAFEGNGGNILLTADQFIASGGSVISASSTLGIDGNVAIAAPDVDILGVLETAPTEFINAQDLQDRSCVNLTAASQSRFFVSIYPDGVPLIPNHLLSP